MNHRRREPAPGVFRLVLPLPFPGLTRVNAYLLNGDDPTLIDCGISDPARDDRGWGELVAAFDACEMKIGDLRRLVITHPHIDHYGMAGRVVDASGCELWMHSAAEEELDSYRDPEGVAEGLKTMLADHGLSAEEAHDLSSFEDWRPFVSEILSAAPAVEDAESFDVGGRSWRVVHTPGHSRSHICLWAEADGVLVSGDHLLPSITPHIDFRRGGDVDPLSDYLESLEKVERLDPKIVLPGHGHPFEEGAERARVVARHHDRRLGSILQVIRREPHTANEIAEEIFGTELLNFDRRLSLGETLAHLVYLRRRGEIERIERDGTFVYKKVSRRRGADEDE